MSASRSVAIVIDGRAVTATEGVTVASALLDAGVTAFRSSTSGSVRGPVCGMGICYECRVTIDDVPHRRACLVVVASGMRVDTASGNA
ncbi:MAG: (2Fe-2S)-binding protein [bacterium]